MNNPMIQYRLGRIPSGKTAVEWTEWRNATTFTDGATPNVHVADVNYVNFRLVEDRHCREESPFKVFSRTVKCEGGIHSGDHYYDLVLDDEEGELRLTW